jgi:hypothetical protein
MKLPDGTILMHANAPYDPRKAHEYYLRTRKLKGRKPGAAQPTAPSTGGAKVIPIRKKHTQVEQLTPQQLNEQRQYAAARVQQIQEKLSKLNAALKKKMAEAKKAEAKAKKPPTAAEKAKAARESKKYRSKHKQAIATKAKQQSAKDKASGKAPSSDSVEGLQKQIDAVKKSLTAAVAAQRALAKATK